MLAGSRQVHAWRVAAAGDAGLPLTRAQGVRGEGRHRLQDAGGALWGAARPPRDVRSAPRRPPPCSPWRRPVMKLAWGGRLAGGRQEGPHWPWAGARHRRPQPGHGERLPGAGGRARGPRRACAPPAGAPLAPCWQPAWRGMHSTFRARSARPAPLGATVLPLSYLLQALARSPCAQGR